MKEGKDGFGVVSGQRFISRGVFCLLLGVAGSQFMGCSAQSDAMKTRVVELEERLRELERNNGRQSVRMEKLEDDMAVLNDRVETNRLAFERRGLARPLPPLAPAYGAPGPEAYTSSPPQYNVGAYRAEPVPDRARARIALPSLQRNLPVVIQQPEGQAPAQAEPKAPEPEEEVGERVVINEESFRQFVEEEGGYVEPPANSAPASRAPRAASPRPGGGTYGRRAKAPVTDERLPVADVNKDSPASEVAQEGVLSARTPMEQYKQGLASYRAGHYDEALKDFGGYLKQGPPQDYLDNAYYWLGECTYGLGKYKEAIGYFDRVIKETPRGNKVPDSMLKASLAYVRLGRQEQAKSILYNLLETYPNTNAAKIATQKLKELE